MSKFISSIKDEYEGLEVNVYCWDNIVGSGFIKFKENDMFTVIGYGGEFFRRRKNRRGVSHSFELVNSVIEVW